MMDDKQTKMKLTVNQSDSPLRIGAGYCYPEDQSRVGRRVSLSIAKEGGALRDMQIGAYVNECQSSFEI